MSRAAEREWARRLQRAGLGVILVLTLALFLNGLWYYLMVVRPTL